jgi:hypothetical protein
VFESYDESKGSAPSSWFKRQLYQEIDKLRARDSKQPEQDTAETDENSVLGNIPNESQDPDVGVFSRVKEKPTTADTPDELHPVVKAFREHVGRHLGEQGIRFLDAMIAGQKLGEVPLLEGESPWTTKRVPMAIKDATKSFAAEQGDDRLAGLVDQYLNPKYKYVGMDNEDELELAGTMGDVLGARPLGGVLTQSGATPHKAPPHPKTCNSGHAGAVQTANKSRGGLTNNPASFSNEAEVELFLSEDEVDLEF